MQDMQAPQPLVQRSVTGRRRSVPHVATSAGYQASAEASRAAPDGGAPTRRQRPLSARDRIHSAVQASRSGEVPVPHSGIPDRADEVLQGAYGDVQQMKLRRQDAAGRLERLQEALSGNF